MTIVGGAITVVVVTGLPATVATVALYLVRHAKAGRRSAWDDDDRLRPLTRAGVDQARAIAAMLAPHGPTMLVSSPYVRCRQTLEPLAEITGLEIVDEPGLAEESTLERSLAVLENAPDGAVMCSHGDVIPMTIDALIRRGMELRNGVSAVKKGSMFELARRSGLFTEARFIPAPEVLADGR